MGILARQQTFFNNYLNENVPDYIRKDSRFPNSCDLNLLDYAIWHMTRKVLYKNLQQYEDIQGFSEAIPDPWDRQTKKFINNSIKQWQMQLGKVAEEGDGRIGHLV